jgi:hypothetical protein
LDRLTVRPKFVSANAEEMRTRVDIDARVQFPSRTDLKQL